MALFLAGSASTSVRQRLRTFKSVPQICAFGVMAAARPHGLACCGDCFRKHIRHYREAGVNLSSRPSREGES